MSFGAWLPSFSAAAAVVATFLYLSRSLFVHLSVSSHISHLALVELWLMSLILLLYLSSSGSLIEINSQ